MNVKIDGGKSNGADSLTQCQFACIGKRECTGYDWIANGKGRRCFLTGAWSRGKKKQDKKLGAVHYDRDQGCDGMYIYGNETIRVCQF